MVNFAVDERLLIARGVERKKVHRVDLSAWIKQGWQIVQMQLVVGTNNEYEGSGVPIAPPLITEEPASYLDTGSGAAYVWSPSLYSWVNTTNPGSTANQFFTTSSDPVAPPGDTSAFAAHYNQNTDALWLWDIPKQEWERSSGGSTAVEYVTIAFDLVAEIPKEIPLSGFTKIESFQVFQNNLDITFSLQSSPTTNSFELLSNNTIVTTIKLTGTK